MAPELYGAVHGYDYATTVRQTIGSIVGRKVELKLYTNSKSLFVVFVNIGITTVKSLLDQLRMMREAYEQRELTEVVCIQSEQNTAGRMRKEKASAALELLMKNNWLNIHYRSWVEGDEIELPPWAKLSPTKVMP